MAELDTPEAGCSLPQPKYAVYPVHTDADFPPLRNDLILRVARGEKVERAPVWIMRQAGRFLPEFRAVRAAHSFFTVCRTPELAATVTLQPIDRFNGLLDASIIFCDILVVPQALGLECIMVPTKGPTFPHPLETPADLARLPDTVDVNEKLGYVFEAITLTRTRLDGRVPLFGFAGCPWTLMAYMIEGGGSRNYEKAKKWLTTWPEASHALLRKLADVVVDFLVGQVKAGAQLLQVFGSSSGELTPKQFVNFSLPYLLEIPGRVRAALEDINPELAKIPIAVFPRGAHYSFEPLSAPGVGYDIVSVDWTMDPAAIRQRTQNRVALQGNLDPTMLFAPKEVIREETREMLQKFGPGEKYIANLGHGILPTTDPEHLRAYLEAIRDISSEMNGKK
ncbi:Uroporphyrinogen decarboxylase [Blyttiomyces helicus]|uniref:Uroporphyrinogen decarboxylase n=1 Tax=Blyttiomyces helicus TaxID=388810 RepID=A0A4P9WBQ3_9FUNG|nr:Uroporphyrinogen decarboxylase [Blyttiomyces helicus]|eukprot:RKO89924.1 Uroporphyrinogen decarboxylase [Blyttiomyces helicus]